MKIANLNVPGTDLIPLEKGDFGRTVYFVRFEIGRDLGYYRFSRLDDEPLENSRMEY